MPDGAAPDVAEFAASATRQRVVLSCSWVDGAACVVAGQLRRDVAPEQFEAIRCLLPCSWCRQAQADACALKGTRLGKREREVLWQLPRCGGVKFYVSDLSSTATP
jgi:hypothetical protein